MQNLLKLKYFSLISIHRTDCYCCLIIPLLRRMLYLEELILFLSILRLQSTYIDGVQLNEDIQRGFTGRNYEQVASYIQTNSRKGESRCHMYSLPYQFRTFFYRSNSFHEDVFHHIRDLFLIDFRPFEHKFFEVISQSFPVLKKLFIRNYEPQINK